MNIDNTAGAVGFVSRIAKNVHPVRLIRIDEVTGVPLRNARGLCIPCEPGEVGKLVGVSLLSSGGAVVSALVQASEIALNLPDN